MPEETSAHVVIVYTQHACEYSEMVRLHLESRGQPYTERNVDEDRAYHEDLVALGMQATPVTVIDGEPVVGFDEESIDRLLGFTPYSA